MALLRLSRSTEDVMEEILSWLPPKYLIQCKCVSKPWNSFISLLIENPSFVNKHLSHINKLFMPSTSIVFRRGSLFPGYRRFNHDKPLSLLTLFHDGADDCVFSVSKILDIPRFEGEKEMGSAWVYYHCNGIFCLVNKFNTIMLCNPELNEFKVVPETKINLLITENILLHDRFAERVGFGYDSRANDYKIIIVYSKPNNITNKGYTIGAEVYDLSTNSWREIKFTEGNIFNHYAYWTAEKKGVYCKGFYYWLGDRNFEQTILSFDMCNEVFHILPSLPNNRLKNVQLTEWNDSLALFSSTSSRSGSNNYTLFVDIWVMEDEQQWKWSKYISIGPLEDIEAPLTFWKCDELLVVTSAFRETASYNIRSKKLRKLAIHRDDHFLCWGSYVKSLVSVNKAKGQ